MPAVVAAYVACALIWGTTWFGIRVCIGAGGYPTMNALALRFIIASAVLLPFALRTRPWPTGRARGYLVLAGVLDAAGYLLVYLGEEKLQGGIAAVVFGTQPLILGLLLTVFKIEPLARRHLVGAVVSIAGVAVLFLDRLDVSPSQAIGILLVLASVAVSTSYSVIMKQHGKGVPAIVSTTIFLSVTAVVLGIVALIAHQPLPWPPPVKPTMALLYLAIVGSAVAFAVYFWLLGKTTLLITSTLVFVFPLVALLTDALFDRAASLGVRAYIGAAITLGGLAVSLRKS